MTQIVVKCPSCKKGLKINKVSEDMPITCPACRHQGKLSEFPVIKLKQVYCPSCKAQHTINAEYVGTIVCPKCKYGGDIKTFPDKLQNQPPMPPPNRPPKADDPNETVVRGGKSGVNDSLYKPGVLILLKGSCSPSKIVLQTGINSIGRKAASSQCSIQLDSADEYMSKKHINIVLVMKPDATFEHRLSDNGSTNGTYHNEEKMDAGDVIILRPNDVIRIGHTTFKFIVE